MALLPSTSDPIVSICVPTHNRANLLAETIKSILSQDFKDFELLIANDNSVDSTEAVIKSFLDPRIVYIKNVQNLGQVGTQNKLTGIARGRYIIFTHDDNILIPSMIGRCVDILEKNPDVIFAVPLSRLINVDGCVVHEPKRVGTQDVYIIDGMEMVYQFLPDFSVNSKVLATTKIETSFPSAVFRTEKVIEVGQFDEEVLIACDLLIQSKLCLMGKIALLNDVLFEYRIHDNWGSKLSIQGTYVDEFGLLMKKLLDFSSSRQDLVVPPNFETELRSRFGRYIFSPDGCIAKITAKYRGDYLAKVRSIIRTAKVGWEYNPSTLRSPKSLIILFIALILPQSIIKRIEKSYLKNALKT